MWISNNFTLRANQSISLSKKINHETNGIHLFLFSCPRSGKLNNSFGVCWNVKAIPCARSKIVQIIRIHEQTADAMLLVYKQERCMITVNLFYWVIILRWTMDVNLSARFLVHNERVSVCLLLFCDWYTLQQRSIWVLVSWPWCYVSTLWLASACHRARNATRWNFDFISNLACISPRTIHQKKKKMLHVIHFDRLLANGNHLM